MVLQSFVLTVRIWGNPKFLRVCLHDNGATFIPGRNEKLHRVYIKPCLLGCESYSAVKLMKL